MNINMNGFPVWADRKSIEQKMKLTLDNGFQSIVNVFFGSEWMFEIEYDEFSNSWFLASTYLQGCRI